MSSFNDSLNVARNALLLSHCVFSESNARLGFTYVGPKFSHHNYNRCSKYVLNVPSTNVQVWKCYVLMVAEKEKAEEPWNHGNCRGLTRVGANGGLHFRELPLNASQ